MYLLFLQLILFYLGVFLWHVLYGVRMYLLVLLTRSFFCWLLKLLQLTVISLMLLLFLLLVGESSISCDSLTVSSLSVISVSKLFGILLKEFCWSRSSSIDLDVSGRLFEEHDGHSHDKLIIFDHKVFVSFRCDASTFYVNPEVTFITLYWSMVCSNRLLAYSTWKTYRTWIIVYINC